MPQNSYGTLSSREQRVNVDTNTKHYQQMCYQYYLKGGL